MSVVIDTIYRIFPDDESSGHLEVGPWTECSDTLELRTADEHSIAWFGSVNLVMTPEFAMAVGHALITAAKEMGAAE